MERSPPARCFASVVPPCSGIVHSPFRYLGRNGDSAEENCNETLWYFDGYGCAGRGAASERARHRVQRRRLPWRPALWLPWRPALWLAWRPLAVWMAWRVARLRWSGLGRSGRGIGVGGQSMVGLLWLWLRLSV